MKACVLIRRGGRSGGSLGPRLRERLEAGSEGSLAGAFETFGEADAVGFLEVEDLGSLERAVHAIEEVEGIADVETLPELVVD